MNNKMGWSLPPGVSNRMIEEAAGTDEPCECCGKLMDDCICEACPNCGESGNPDCYEGKCTAHEPCPKCFEGECTHAAGMDCPKPKLCYSKEQRLGQSDLKISNLQQQIADEGRYRAWLEDQPDEWRDES